LVEHPGSGDQGFGHRARLAQAQGVRIQDLERRRGFEQIRFAALGGHDHLPQTVLKKGVARYRWKHGEQVARRKQEDKG
jgi:hypothetical protein